MYLLYIPVRKYNLSSLTRTWLSGRALASQAEDREFESRRPLHKKCKALQGIAVPF